MNMPSQFRVDIADYARDGNDLHVVRDTVFVQEQQVPPELECDALDPDCLHVLARDESGQAIGTGRLTPDRRIGRMAVLPQWRGRGVGAALLQALLAAARARGWDEVSLHAQVSAIAFYLHHDFQPRGERFMEAGIEHQTMVRALHGPEDAVVAITRREDAVSMLAALIRASRRRLWIYSRELDPGLLDAPEVLEALRRFATAGHDACAMILLQDAAAPQRAHAALLPLAQRLPSAFAFREVDDPVDRTDPSAFVVNDRGGYYFRALGQRLEGEAELHSPGRARQLRENFEQIWERSRPISEYRALRL